MATMRRPFGLKKTRNYILCPWYFHSSIFLFFLSPSLGVVNAPDYAKYKTTEGKRITYTLHERKGLSLSIFVHYFIYPHFSFPSFVSTSSSPPLESEGKGGNG
ncbi:hypothetical protein, unlikely [Trypanosoma brucei gambiense DAL972]|uniref:Uncharacterized protein n=1 Tax=Trypanosoma brucei gambiense (strain MHOM/CI/86/DAL972) TaxID=679716 RepID=C9ZSG2_TRYB9|nr:hypothetical protein, unlikely [Trypanosoma brucei gambiense DAL972]CBH12346.1 hypothetical protein, unlikely [Trypanosoma brucei gambiense DAL972]|eukprot:XP_011774627.1 hypothetical protein, unlikely [Trypanosoma brucei gambiense DAL972]